MQIVAPMACALAVVASVHAFLSPTTPFGLSSWEHLALAKDTASVPESATRLSWRQHPRSGCRARALMMNKGFGPQKPKKSMPKSKKRIEADSAAKKYDELAASGIPEYNIFIKPKGTEDYLPAGVMAVPRSQQISQAVFEQEANLKEAAFRFYTKLQKYDEFEYGYTLKMFPDDPITPIEVRPPSTNAFGRFFEGLLNPVNTAGMKGPEIEPPQSSE